MKIIFLIIQIEILLKDQILKILMNSMIIVKRLYKQEWILLVNIIW